MAVINICVMRPVAVGAGALIHKPNDVEELCDIVQQLVHGKSAPH